MSPVLLTGKIPMQNSAGLELDMSIYRLGLGLKFDKFTFDWMFLS